MPCRAARWPPNRHENPRGVVGLASVVSSTVLVGAKPGRMRTRVMVWSARADHQTSGPPDALYAAVKALRPLIVDHVSRSKLISVARSKSSKLRIGRASIPLLANWSAMRVADDTR